MARARFLCCERSSWHSTTSPVGRWVMRMAESVVLTCCPPAPEARKVSIFSSAGLMSTASTSSTRSEEHTSELQSRGHLVCRHLLEKKKDCKGHLKIESVDNLEEAGDFCENAGVTCISEDYV